MTAAEVKNGEFNLQQIFKRLSEDCIYEQGFNKFLYSRLEKNCPDVSVVELFYIIGYMPDGVSKEEICEIRPEACQ